MSGFGGAHHPSHPRLRHIWRAIAVTAVCSVLAFHVWLFLSRVADGQVSDPLVALRWGAGLVLAGLLAWLKHRGIRTVRSRSAAACWILVLFLHWSALSPESVSARDVPPVATPSAALVVLPVAGWLGALGAGVFLLLAARRVPAPRLAPAAGIPTAGVRAAVSPGFIVSKPPRAPPAW